MDNPFDLFDEEEQNPFDAFDAEPPRELRGDRRFSGDVIEDAAPEVTAPPVQGAPEASIRPMARPATGGFAAAMGVEPEQVAEAPAPAPQSPQLELRGDRRNRRDTQQISELGSDGTAVGRAVKRGALRLGSSLPMGMAVADATALADSQMTDQELIADSVRQATGLDSLPDGLDLSTPEKAAAAIAGIGFGAERANIFRSLYDNRTRRAAEARSEPARFATRGATNLSYANSLIEKAASLPMSEAGERMKQELAKDTTFGGTVAAMLKDPAGTASFLAEVGVESAPVIAGSAVTGLVTRSPAASAMAMGLGAVGQEFGSSASEFLDENGVRLDSEEDAVALLNNAPLMKAAAKRGATRAVVIAAFEALGQGAAAKQLLKSKVGNALVESAVQAATGSGGEAAARLAAGQEMSGQEILIEGLAEFVTTPAEVGAAAVSKSKGQTEGQTGAPPSGSTTPPPNLTPDDIASPLPNDILSEGKSAIEAIARGEAPTAPRVAPEQAQAPDAGTPPVAPVATPAVEAQDTAPDAPVAGIPEGAIPLETLYDKPTRQSAPERPSEAGSDQAPDAPAGPIRPANLAERAPAAPPQPDPEFETLPIYDNGRETGEFVRINKATGEVQRAEPGVLPEVDQSTPQPKETAPRETPAEAAQLDLDQPAAAPDVATPAPTREIEILSNEDLTGIETDAETFQYKSGGDASGVTDRLLNVRQWDTGRAGSGIVFEYKDGRRVVADGHQRLGLAKRLRAEGQDVSMPVIIRREADGYTPQQVMIEAAMKNIAESSVKGTPDPQQVVDAAKVMRTAPEITAEEMNLPPSSALVRQAQDVRNLSDDAFGMLVNEKAGVRNAAAVGRAVEDKAAHANILGMMEKLPIKNAFEAEQVAKQAAAETVTETQDSLFGPEDATETLFLERARVMDNALKRLRKDRATFNTLLQRGGTITEAGNQLDQDANQRRLKEDASVQEYLTRQANSKGPISDALSEAARDVKGGADIGQTVTRFVGAVRGAIESNRETGETVERNRRPDEPAGAREEGQSQPVEEAKPEPAEPPQQTAVPTFEEFRAALPQDSEGYADVTGAGQEAMDRAAGDTGSRWDTLTDAQRKVAFQSIGGELRAAEPGPVQSQLGRADDAVSQKSQLSQRTEAAAEPEPKPKSAAPKKLRQQINTLRKFAESAISKADANLGRDRNTNTARRARMAAGAEADATKRKRNAETAQRIADVIEQNPETKLGGVKSLKDIERVESFLSRAQYKRLQAAGEYRHDWRPDISVEDADAAEAPSVLLRQGDVRDLLAETKGKRGVDRRRLQRLEVGNTETYSNIRGEDVDAVEAALKVARKAGKLPYGLKSLQDEITDFKALERIGGGDLKSALREYLETRSGTTVQKDPVKEARTALIGNKIPGFFETPDTLAQRMVDMAGIKPGDKVLEPSAGGGRIATKLAEAAGAENLDAVEVNSTLQDLLKAQGIEPKARDFMDYDGDGYNAIVMNPPFEKRQDADHVQRAYDKLAPGGRLVSIMGEGVFFGSDRRATEFRNWLEEVGGEVEKLPEGTFKESGTGVNSRLVQITKPEGEIGVPEAAQPATEVTPEGEQTLVPGVEPISQRDRLEAAQNKPLDGGNAEMPGGRDSLFGDPMDRADLFDESREKPGRKFQRGADFAADFATELSVVDDLFRYPKTRKNRHAEALAEIDPTVEYVGEAVPADITADEPEVQKHHYRTAKGRDFFLHETEDEVWFDVSRLDEGDGGSGLYAAVADYAANTGKLFIGDPEGLSKVALRRRTEAMLSSALKRGTTKHLAPHEYQIKGDTDLGVPPLVWRRGDDHGNVRSLIEVSVASAEALVPQLKDASYDFETGTFRNGEGQPLTDESLDSWASSAQRAGEASLGRSTLKRSILLRSLLRAESSDQPGLLERVLRQPHQLVGQSLDGVFYRAASTSSPRIDADKWATIEPKLQERLRKLMIRGVDLRLDQDMVEQGATEITPEGDISILIGQAVDPEGTVNHEAIHVLRARGLFTAKEWAALEGEASKIWMRKYDIAEWYGDLSQEEQIEEAIAEAFADFAAGKSAPTNVIKAVFAKIKRFLRAVRETLVGEGVRSPEDIFEMVEKGDIGARPFDDAPAAMHAAQRPSSAVRKLTPAGQQQIAASTHSAVLPNDTMFERFRRNVQDRMLSLRRMREVTEKAAGATIGKAEDPYFAEERYTGRVGHRLDVLEEEYTRPLISLISKAPTPIEITDQHGETRTGARAVSLWLMARHAKERNAHIAKINDAMPDGGSGLTNAEADAILNQAGAHAQRLNQIGALTDRLGKEMIDLRENVGLLSSQDAHIWRTMYRHYVPLQSFAENDMYDGILNERGTGMGRRFNVRGQEGQRALGRSSEAFDPLATLLAQAQEVTVRAEKNRVAKTFYNFAVRYPNPALYEVTQPEQQRYFDKATGKVETRTVSPGGRQIADNEMALKVDGKEYRVTLKDPRLAEAMGKIGTNELGKVSQFASHFSRYFSTINTMLSPPFVITNAFRDMMTAQVNLGEAAGEDAGKLRKAAMRDWVKALRGAYRGMDHKYDTDYSKWFKEYSEVGGKIHFWQIEDPEGQSLDFNRRVDRASKGAVRRNLTAFTRASTRDNPALHMIEHVNLAVDNAVRLATYVEARKNGWTKEDAASLSKNLTVNFNRRGDIGATMNAWYPFANAAVQGSQVILKAMKSRNVLKITGGMILYGIASDWLAAALSGEDEDGELEYDQLPAYKSERSIIVPTPIGDDGYITIPLPYGYNAFFFAGQQIGKVARGVKDPNEAAGHLLAATITAFSPIGGETGFQMLAPTVLDFANEFDNNQDWLGRPIRPENPYGDYGPQSYKEYAASAPSRALARAMNTVSGGSPLSPGAIDVSPEYIDHFFKFLSGGAGRFAGRVYGLGERAVEGTLAETEAYEVPLARVLFTESGDFLNQGRYFEFREAVQEARWQVKQAAEIGHPATKAMRDAASLWPALSAAEKQRRQIGNLMDTIYANDRLTNKQRSAQLKPLKERRNKIYLQFNRAFISKMGPQAE